MRLRTTPLLTSACVYTLCAQLAGAALTGLALPPLDLSGLQHAGGWASANSLVFTDLMKHSSASYSAGTRAAGTNNSWGYLSPSSVTWRSDGYPAGLTPPNNRTQWSVVTIIGAGRAYYNAGRYIVLYDGDGNLELDGDAVTLPVSSAAGRMVVNITPNNSTVGLRVRITASNASNPVVNIRIVPEAYESTYNTTQVFHPDFLAMLQGIPLLRFSFWNRATGNSDNSRAAPRNWTARTTPLHSTQVREADGVAVEHLVQLANTINASMWISLPRAANNTDTYIVNMLKYIATILSSSLSLTVEYGINAPGWLSSHLTTSTKLISEVARSAWVASGRPLSQLRVVMTCPSSGVLGSVLMYAGTNLSYIDAIALPASFGGGEYFSATYDNPTGWASGTYFATPRTITVDSVLKMMRSSVMSADMMYNKVFQTLRAMGISVVGYAAGPELRAPMYGSRANYDRAWTSCGGNVSWPCNITTVYPPWSFPDGASAIVWGDRSDFNATFYGTLAANASIEAAAEDILRQVRLHDNMTQIVLDSLWRWHAQMGGSDLVVDVARLALSCSEAAGTKTGIYAPAECRANANGTAVAASTARPTDVPTFNALKAWLAAAGPDATAAATAAPGLLPQSAATAPLAVPRPANCSPSCVYGTCVSGTCKCWVGVSGATCDELPSVNGTPSACNPRVGINLEGISDWSHSWTFVDVFKASREWISQGFTSTLWSTGTYVTLINSSTVGNLSSALGYPAFLAVDQKVSTLVIRDLRGHIPGGVYTVLFDGKGVLDFRMDDVKYVEWVEAGHVRVTFKPSTNMNNGILVMVERTDPTDPLRNIRVLTPGYEAASEWGGAPFHPALLSYLRPFGMLRFMDWMHTNNENTPSQWSERPTTQDRSYAVHPGGVALEHMILLCNMLGADPWFNIPYAATDDYITSFAAAVRDDLRPDLKVYVEYGNELWHTGFPGGQYAQAQGLAMNLTEEGNKWYGGATNEARLCFVAHRTANISKLWKDTWGAQSGRVQVVVSGQSVWSITSDKLLSCGNASAHIDALAIAPYFGSYDKARDTNVTVFVNETLRSQLNGTFTYVAAHAKIAAKYGKPFLTYESGQGLVGDGTSDDVAIQANRHPLMAEIYRLYLSGLVANNVSRIMHFSSIGPFTKYGSWGLTEYQDQDPVEAPKYQGLMTFLNASLNCSLPPPPDPATCPGSCSGNGDCLADSICMCYSGYSGADCSNATYTEVYNCGYYCTFNQGWCNVSTVSGNIRTWGCTCKPGIGGLTCSIVSCPNNCSWNGECLDQGICACYPGFSGYDCGTDCGCGGHGSCDDSGGCICDVGWRLSAVRTCEWDCGGCDDGTSCIGPGECGCAEDCVYGTCYHGACRCWAGFGGPACNVSEPEGAASGVPVVPRLNRGSLAGINVAGIAYYTTEWVWLNAMKGSSDWFTSYLADTVLENAWDTGAELELRSDGYPARLPDNTMAHKLLLRDMSLHVWPGRYVILYDGDGRLDFSFDATVSSRAKGRIEILFNPTANLACVATGAAYCSDNGISLRITASNPNNPMRNIRVLPLGDPSSGSAGGPGAGGAWEGRANRAAFHPWFLKSMARYRVIRFMVWMDTNTNTSWIAASGGVLSGSEAWSARTTPAHDTQTRDGGVAYEHMIELCNVIGADPWFTVHHLADDTYVTELATLVRNTLRPDVNVYIEHSNEVWNPLFSQNAYARVRGVALGLSSDAATASYRYHALRTIQIAGIFKSVFASAPGNGSQRIKVVLGGWSYLCSSGKGCGAVVAKETLGWNGTAAKVDYFGITAYWSCGLGSNGATDVLLTVDQMLTKCKTLINSTVNDTAALVALVSSYNVPPITYEAGPSIVESSSIQNGGSTAGLATKFIAVNRHADMYGLYKSYLEVFRKAGLVGEGRPFMQFVSTGLNTKYGSWGLQEYTGQPMAEAHKYRAYMDWLDNQANYTGAAANATNVPPRRAVCMDLRAQGGAGAGVSGAFGGGGVTLAEGLLAGPPAVMLPAAGQIFVQGQTVTFRWSTVGWDDGTYNGTISFWADTDCQTDAATGSQQQLSNNQSLAVLHTGQSQSGMFTVQVPPPGDFPVLDTLLAEFLAEVEADAGRSMPRFFIRFSDGRTTNYSEPFHITPLYAYAPGLWSDCNCSTSTQTRDILCLDMQTYFNTTEYLPYSYPAPNPSTPTCTNYTGWVVLLPSTVGDPYCSIVTSTGCRSYRTERSGKWPWSAFKPVTDCTAQSSPWPATSLPLASSYELIFTPLSQCSYIGASPPTTRECPADACPSNPASSPPPPPPPATSSSPPPPPVVVPYCSQSSTATALALLNTGTTTCELSSSTCGEASVCTAVANCKRWVCNAATQSLVQESCTATCQPLTLVPLSAKLSDDGRSVLVTLSARAGALVRVSCASVFEATSAGVLGGRGSLCSTTSNDAVLVAGLAANATLALNGQQLVLSSTGSRLVAAADTSRAFIGSVNVSACTSCVGPTARLSGPTTLPATTTCESASGSLLGSAATRSAPTFDASASEDPSGRTRWAAVRWTYGGPGAEGALLSTAIQRANSMADVSDRLRLSLTSSEEAALQDNVTYTVQVTVNSWLGTSSSANLSFYRPALAAGALPAPSVSVSGPATQTFRISSGLRLTAAVAGGGCKGRTLYWRWSSPSSWYGLPTTGLTSQTLSLRAPVSGITHGQNVTLRVTASYENNAASSSSTFEDVVVIAQGAAPLASLTGPSGDTSDDTALLFNATASSDPDATVAGARTKLNYVWSCSRVDNSWPCFMSADQGDKISNPGVWRVPAELIASGSWYTVTVTVVKDTSAGATPLNASASVTFRLRSASLPFPRGTLTRQCSAAACASPHSTDQDLTVLLQLASPYNTTATASTVTVTWSSTDAPSISNLAALTAVTTPSYGLPAGAYLLTIPASMLPATRSSLTITANLTTNSTSVSADAATSAASLTVPINGAPYCSFGSNASSCLATDTLNATFPSAVVVLRARGWVDGSDGDDASAGLRYEFGVRQAVGSTTVNVVQQRGAATSATLVGLAQGVSQLYGCAIDTSGSRTCGSVNVTVAPPGVNFDASAALAAINVTALVAANDQTTLLQAALQTAQLVLTASSSISGSNSSAISELLGEMSVALVSAMMNGGALQDAEQAPQAIAAMAALASSAATLPDRAKDAYMSAVQSAVQLLFANASSSGSDATTGSGLTSFVSQLCSLMGASLPSTNSPTSSVTANSTAISSSGRRLAETATSTTSTTSSTSTSTSSTSSTTSSTSAAARSRLADLLTASDQMGDALGRRVVPRGSDMPAGASGVFVSAAAIPPGSSAGNGSTVVQATVTLHAGPDAAASSSTSTTTSARRRLMESTGSSSYDANVGAQLFLVDTAAMAASGYGIDLSYISAAAPALSTALSTSLPTSVSLVSGLAAVTWNPPSSASATATPPSLDGSNSYLLLNIPVSSFNASRVLNCLSYNVANNIISGNLTGLSAGDGSVVAASYNATSGRVTCRVTAAGSYVVAHGQSAEVSSEEGHGSDSHTAVIVGAVVGGVGGLLVLAGVVVGAVVLARRGRQVQVQPGSPSAWQPETAGSSKNLKAVPAVVEKENPKTLI